MLSVRYKDVTPSYFLPATESLCTIKVIHIIASAREFQKEKRQCKNICLDFFPKLYIIISMLEGIKLHSMKLGRGLNEPCRVETCFRR